MTHKTDSSRDLVWESPAGPDLGGGGEPLGRRATGLLVGLALAAIYSLVAGTIDVVVMRDVPLRLDWPSIWMQTGSGALAGAALGALTAWPVSTWRGILIGGAGVIGWYFLQTVVKVQAAAVLFLPLFVPLLVICLPIAALVRWLAGRQQRLQVLSGRRRWRAQVTQVLLITALGGLAGSWAQMSPAAQEAVRRVHVVVGRALAAPAGAPLTAALRGVPEIRAHAASPYTLDQRPIPGTSDQVDVRVVFADGYVIRCATDLKTGWLECRPGDTDLYDGAGFGNGDGP